MCGEPEDAYGYSGWLKFWNNEYRGSEEILMQRLFPRVKVNECVYNQQYDDFDFMFQIDDNIYHISIQVRKNKKGREKYWIAATDLSGRENHEHNCFFNRLTSNDYIETFIESFDIDFEGLKIASTPDNQKV